MNLADMITFVVIILALVVAVGALISAFYITHVYRLRREQALFLDLLVQLAIRVSFASAIIMFYIASSLSGFILPKPWGAVTIGVPVIIMMSVPISIARLWYLERRKP